MSDQIKPEKGMNLWAYGVVVTMFEFRHDNLDDIIKFRNVYHCAEVLLKIRSC